MILLLDTHAFIWWDTDLTRLSSVALNALRDPSNTILLSVVSIWEIQIKTQLGKYTLNQPLTQIVAAQQANGIQVLDVTLHHVWQLESLPAPHKDPFDRLLIAQANAEGAALFSADGIFSQYPVQIVW